MNGTKAWYESKGVWGANVAIGASILGLLFGIEITELQQAEIVDLIVRILALGGAIMAGIGRLKAKDRIV